MSNKLRIIPLLRLGALVALLFGAVPSYAQSSSQAGKARDRQVAADQLRPPSDSLLPVRAMTDSLLFRPDRRNHLRKTSGEMLRLSPDQRLLYQRQRRKQMKIKE